MALLMSAHSTPSAGELPPIISCGSPCTVAEGTPVVLYIVLKHFFLEYYIDVMDLYCYIIFVRKLQNVYFLLFLCTLALNMMF